jgi:hypothetical protein
MTDTLFEMAPLDDQRKKAKKAKRKPVEAQKPAETFVINAAPVEPESLILGRVDGFECVDTSCRCGVHDITAVGPVQWHLRCWACGLGWWTDPIDDRFDDPQDSAVPARQEVFVFDDGWAAGKSIDEVAAECGVETVRLMAEDKRHPGWQEPLKTWLARSAGTR